MSDYTPEYRRPIAGRLRTTANAAVKLCVKADIHPDTVSYMSVVSAVLAGVCFWMAPRFPWLLVIAPGFCYMRLWCNMLDGMVALASGKASQRGEILNEFPDRISDTVIFIAIGYSGFCNEQFGFWAAIMALLTAYTGTLGQAVGVQREYSGMMSKPWRMVTVHIGAWAAFAVFYFKLKVPGPFSVLDWTCLAVVAGCVQTIILRLVKIFAALSLKAKNK